MSSDGGSLTVGRWVRDRAALTPARVAVDFRGETITYAQLDASSESLANGLLDAGLATGDRVATLTGNRPEHVEVLFACAKVGLALVPLNPRLAASELAYQLEDAEPALLIAAPEQEALAEAALAEARHAPRRASLDPHGLEDLRASGADRADVSVADDDPLLVVYTSGTTGRPKGAVLTHANCFWTNLSLDRVFDVTTTDIVLQVLPQFHVGGWNVHPLLAWWKGATVVLEPDFDPGRALELIATKGVTTMMGVPATYLFMAEHPAFAATDLSSLRMAVVGGAPMPERLLAVYHDRGVALGQGYGLTEAAPNVLGLPAEALTRKRGSAGMPYPHVDVALVDTDTGEPLDGPARGELIVRGPNVFAGYWRNPSATAEVLRDGWLHTGDVAERDADGCYRIVDRTKDMFVSGGENVYPAEVEAVLASHPDVIEAAVVGMPDERWGEVGLATVVCRQDSCIEADELLAFCRERLARYKTPKQVRFVAELPRNAVGKVLKERLRADAAWANR